MLLKHFADVSLGPNSVQLKSHTRSLMGVESGALDRAGAHSKGKVDERYLVNRRLCVSHR